MQHRLHHLHVPAPPQEYLEHAQQQQQQQQQPQVGVDGNQPVDDPDLARRRQFEFAALHECLNLQMVYIIRCVVEWLFFDKVNIIIIIIKQCVGWTRDKKRKE